MARQSGYAGMRTETEGDTELRERPRPSNAKWMAAKKKKHIRDEKLKAGGRNGTLTPKKGPEIGGESKSVCSLAYEEEKMWGVGKMRACFSQKEGGKPAEKKSRELSRTWSPPRKVTGGKKKMEEGGLSRFVRGQ